MPTSKGEGREGNGNREGRDGKEEGKKGREREEEKGRADPRPGLEKCKGGNLNNRSIHSNVNLQ